MSVAVVRVRRHDWPRAHARLLAIGVPFSTGVTVLPGDGSGWVEVLIASALAPVLDGFARVRDDPP